MKKNVGNVVYVEHTHNLLHNIDKSFKQLLASKEHAFWETCIFSNMHSDK